MKTKSTILFLLFVFALNASILGQNQSVSITYTSGDIEVDEAFAWPNSVSSCPGLLNVPVPDGATVINTDVYYEMTSIDPESMAQQNSKLVCTSPGGISEEFVSYGSGYLAGTMIYDRTDLNIANAVSPPTGGAGVDFELHAGTGHWQAVGCSADFTKVDNNTWTVTVTYIPAGFPTFAINPSPADGALYVGVDDDLTWDFGSYNETYDLFFGTDNPPTTQYVFGDPAGDSGSFDPGTMMETETYYWQIVSHNTSGTTPGPVWSFTTECGAFAVPFSEDFETTPLDEVPYCWRRIVDATSQYAGVGVYDFYGSVGPNSLALTNGDDPQATLFFITPEIDLAGGSIADFMVSFDMGGNGFPLLKIGTITDPTDESTFTSVQTEVAYDPWGGLTSFEVFFSGVSNGDTYIAFQMDPTTSYQEIFIDNIVVDVAPSCLKPINLFADNLTINSAWLNWTDMNGATSWNIEYGLAGFTPGTGTTVSGVSNPHEITGLSSSTEYNFYVQADCGGGDISDWSDAGTFLTPCDFYVAPFSENFDGVGYDEMPVCWSNIVLTTDPWAMNGVIDWDSYSPPNNYLMSNGGDLASTLLLVSPPMTTLSDKRVKFYARSNMNEDLIIGTITNPDDPGTFTQLTSVSVTNTYTEFDIWFNTYTGYDQYFAFKHGSTATWVDINIDDISVELLSSCLPPTNNYVDNITSTTADFHWTESGTAVDWIIEVGATGFVPGTGNYINQYTYNNQSGTNQSYDLSGLTAGTGYDVYVQADCGSGDLSEWSGPVTFITSYEYLTLPVIEDFESGFGVTGNDLSNTTDWVIDNSLFHNGSSSAYNAYTLDNENMLLVLGKLDFTAESVIGLTFWHIAKVEGSYDQAYVEISTDGGLTYDQLPESTYAGSGNYTVTQWGSPEGPCFNEESYADWGTGSEIPDNTWWKHEAFDLSSYGGYNDVQIRFRLTSDGWVNRYGWSIDDIEINTFADPAISVNPNPVLGEATPLMPANIDLEIENTGGFALNYAASVIYDEVELFYESFDAGLPMDWTVINNGNSDYTWMDTTAIEGSNFNGTKFMLCDGRQGWGPASLTMDDELISPVIDATTYIGGGLLLEWDQFYDAHWSGEDTARVLVFDGANWIKIYESWTDDGLGFQGPVHKSFDVSAYANDNFQVKFHYIDGPNQTAYYFAVEDVRLRATTGAFGWLSLDGGLSTSGAAFASDGPSIVDVQMDAIGLAHGTYYADIEVISSDPTNPTIIVPCTLNVIQGFQEYTLDIGYKFISSRIIPENPDMMDVLANILNENLDFVRNSSGFMLRKIGPNWINSIGDWITTEGYLFKMLGQDEFSISGEVIDPQTPISLAVGYQFVSYLPENPMNALDAFTDVLENLEFVRNSAGFMLRKIGPTWVNSIGDLIPGEGYLVKMINPDDLIYPVAAEKFTGLSNIKPVYFNFEGGNAADPVYTMYVSGLEIGDEVAVYDGDVLVGSTVIRSDNKFENSLPIFSTLTNSKGFNAGNQISLKVWGIENQMEVVSNCYFESGFDAYTEQVFPSTDGEYSFVNILKGAGIEKTAFDNVSVYPNPATDNINILSNETIIDVQILNFLGQVLLNTEVNDTQMKINTSDYQPGVYIFKISTVKATLIKKVTIK